LAITGARYSGYTMACSSTQSAACKATELSTSPDAWLVLHLRAQYTVKLRA